jgi:hypothetical protein
MIAALLGSNLINYTIEKGVASGIQATIAPKQRDELYKFKPCNFD